MQDEVACSHDGFHAIHSRYDRRDGVLVYYWTCERCGARLNEAPASRTGRSLTRTATTGSFPPPRADDSKRQARARAEEAVLGLRAAPFPFCAAWAGRLGGAWLPLSVESPMRSAAVPMRSSAAAALTRTT